MAQAYVVLTAAGSGSRLGSSLPKALVELGSDSLLTWSLMGIEGAVQQEGADIGGVCITAPVGHIDEFLRQVSALSLSFPVCVVAGGESRQGSVYQGLIGLEELAGGNIAESAVILVHDAARCLTSPKLINSLIKYVEGGVPAVIPGLPVTDTIKEVKTDGGPLAQIMSTPSRANLRSIQTPQAFTWAVLRQAHERGKHLAVSEAFAATDDASLVEAMGVPAMVCPGSPIAFKVTTASDLEAAEQLVQQCPQANFELLAQLETGPDL